MRAAPSGNYLAEMKVYQLVDSRDRPTVGNWDTKLDGLLAFHSVYPMEHQWDKLWVEMKVKTTAERMVQTRVWYLVVVLAALMVYHWAERSASHSVYPMEHRWDKLWVVRKDMMRAEPKVEKLDTNWAVRTVDSMAGN